MPRPDSRNPSFTAAIATTLLLVTCSAPGVISYERALEISRKAAVDQGYNITEYKLDSFGDPGAEAGKWLIVYNCAPVASPGCSFMVVVDRKTGLTEIHPGE